jgi:predicted ATPase
LAQLGSEEVWTETAVSQLSATLNLYRGDFLAGFYVTDSLGLEEWIVVERERWQRTAVLALRHLVTHYINSGQYIIGLQAATRLLQFDPLSEVSQRHMMTLLARTGQRNAALHQYETCRQLLADELGVAPATATTVLYQRLKQAPENPPINLPPQYSLLIGRDKEIAQIIGRLSRPSCRLLTLWGPGGVGKTRLAMAVAAQLSATFLDGIYFIPLAPLPTADLLPLRLSEILNIPLSGSQTPPAQLKRYLQDKEMLLVLDNSEHLLDELTLPLDILQTAPHVKLLITSRERLNVRAEWVLPLDGLPFPETLPSNDTPYPAAQLFAERAAQVGADWQLAEVATAVHRICQLVDGNPLSLELAAAATFASTPAHIAGQIAHNLDFLATTMRDVPARHRSVRAVFEHSWQLLTLEEQHVFAQLSIFRDGITVEAAQAVTAVSPAMLTSFVHKSLLHSEPSGRYDMHDLLRQFAAEKLTTDAQTAVQSEYGRYFCQFLAQRNHALRAERQKEALAEITADIENVRTFWRHAVSQQDIEALGQSLICLYRFYDTISWFQEGYEMFKTAVDSLAPIADSFDLQQTVYFAHMLSRQGWFLSRLDRRLEAADFLQRSLDLYRQVGDVAGESIALNDLGIVVYRLGDYARSKRLALEGLAIARAQNDQWKAAATLTNLGNICRAMGDYAEARDYLLEGTAIMRHEGDSYSLANLVNNLGELERALGDYRAAKNYYAESLVIRRELEDQFGIAFSLNNLGAVAYNTGDVAEAKRLYDESLAILQGLKADGIVVYPLSGLGRLARDAGLYGEALGYFQQALRLSQLESNAPRVLNVLFEAATVLLPNKGHQTLAHTLLRLVKEHPKTDNETRLLAQAYQPAPAPTMTLSEVIDVVLALEL